MDGTTMWMDRERQLVVPPDDNLKKELLRELHNHWGARYLGRDETTR
jgi:hypothetical protein